jgi:hypothetical protein
MSGTTDLCVGSGVARGSGGGDGWPPGRYCLPGHGGRHLVPRLDVMGTLAGGNAGSGRLARWSWGRFGAWPEVVAVGR